MNDPASACPTDAVLGSFYAGELEPREDEAVRDHLVSCAACRERARDAAAFAGAMKHQARGVPVWAMAMAAVFAAAVILVLWRTAGPPRPPEASPDVASAKPVPGSPDARAMWQELAVEPAPYEPDESRGILWRGGEEPPAANAAGSFAWAMEPYRAGEFAEAAGRLGQRLRAEPNDERASFYLGVSQLLAGHPDEAVEPLRRAAEGTDPRLAGASWYLALACLETGDEDRAVRLLRDLAAKAGDQGERARELLAEIEGRPKR